MIRLIVVGVFLFLSFYVCSALQRLCSYAVLITVAAAIVLVYVLGVGVLVSYWPDNQLLQMLYP